MTPTKCPGGCGTVLDYETVPSYSKLRERAGKFCPTCGHPLDRATAEADHQAYGPDSEAVMKARADAADNFHKGA